MERMADEKGEREDDIRRSGWGCGQSREGTYVSFHCS